MKIFFDVLNIYYLPQYIPVYEELNKRGHSCRFVVYSKKNDQSKLSSLLEEMGVESTWVYDLDEARELYIKDQPDWIFFGNLFPDLDDIHKFSKTVQMGHGVGPKPSYYNKSSVGMTVRFVEGDLRLEKIKSLFPEQNFQQVGFSKLDPVFNKIEKGIDMKKAGLDPNKPTLLYAPTFNPTSLGCFPKDWPKEFEDYNILIKVHGLTLARDRYKKEQKLINQWRKYPNVYVADIDEFSLVPFLVSADILISEASSTLFEFAALNKPVVICDFYDLKWSYKGLFKYRFEKRFGDSIIYDELGAHAKSYKHLKQKVEEELALPTNFEVSRKAYTRDHIGPTDGKASERIVDYIENN